MKMPSFTQTQPSRRQRSANLVRWATASSTILASVVAAALTARPGSNATAAGLARLSTAEMCDTNGGDFGYICLQTGNCLINCVHSTGGCYIKQGSKDYVQCQPMLPYSCSNNQITKCFWTAWPDSLCTQLPTCDHNSTVLATCT
jgi:hypothetical protein